MPHATTRPGAIHPGITALKNGTNTRLLTRDPASTILNQRDGPINHSDPSGNAPVSLDCFLGVAGFIGGSLFTALSVASSPITNVGGVVATAGSAALARASFYTVSREC